MRKLLMITTLVLATLSTYAADTAGTTITAAAGYEQVTARVAVKTVKGIPVPQVDQGVFKYVKNVSFVYNKNKTKALMIMDVRTEDAAVVKGLLSQKKTYIDPADADNVEKEFRGYKKRFNKHKARK